MVKQNNGIGTVSIDVGTSNKILQTYLTGDIAKIKIKLKFIPKIGIKSD